MGRVILVTYLATPLQAEMGGSRVCKGMWHYSLAGVDGGCRLRAAMILTAQSPTGEGPSIPLSFLEEVRRVLSKHKAVRLVPEDEAVTVEEARRLLHVPQGFVEDAVALGAIKRSQSGESGGAPMVRLDSVLEYQKARDKSPPRNALDEFFDEVKAEGLY